MQLGTMNIRRIDLTGSVIAGCVVAIFYAIGLRPLLTAINQQTEIANEIQQLQRSNNQAFADTKTLQTTLGTLDQQLAGVHRLSDRKQVNHTISLVTELALTQGLVVESSTAKEPQNSTMFAIVPIRISGKGDYVATTRFIHALNTQHADIELQTLTLNAAPGTGTGQPTFEIELAWYVLPE